MGRTSQSGYKLLPQWTTYFGYVSPYIDSIGKNSLYLFIFFIVSAKLALIGAVGTHYGKKHGLRHLMHLAWTLKSILMVLGFLSSIITFPGAVVLVELCGVWKNM